MPVTIPNIENKGVKKTGKISAFKTSILIGRDEINKEPNETRVSGPEECWKWKEVTGQDGKGETRGQGLCLLRADCRGRRMSRRRRVGKAAATQSSPMSVSGWRNRWAKGPANKADLQWSRSTEVTAVVEVSEGGGVSEQANPRGQQGPDDRVPKVLKGRREGTKQYRNISSFCVCSAVYL